MATVAEIVYDVREMLKLYSDDAEVSNSYIKYLYNIKRAKYLRRELNNFQRTADNSALQTLCINLELVDANECDVKFDCEKILRSTKPIPRPLDLHTAPAIVQVKPTTITSEPFNFVTKERIAYASSTPFKGIYSFLDPDGYIYVYSKSNIKMLECLTITGVFENPSDLQAYPACCGCNPADNPCFDDKVTDYPLQPHLIDLIKLEIVNELAQRTNIRQDNENDAEDTQA